MTAMLEVNDLVESLTEPPELDGLCRVLWVDRPNDRALLMVMEDSPKQPFPRQLSLLEGWIRAGTARKTTLKPPVYMLRSDLTDAARASRDSNWERIAPLVATKAIFEPEAMGTMVSQRAAELSLPRKSLYRILYRFWMNGQVRDALLPNYEQSGAPGKAKQFADGKRNGRRPKFQGLELEDPRQALTEADKSSIKLGYALYKSNAVESISDAYIKTLRRFYAPERKIAGVSDDDIELRPMHELPTLRQFTYWGQKAFDELDVLRGRRGEKNWNKDHRALSGRVGDGVRGPCHRFEIDATIADIYLVSRYNRNWIIGRPVVYVVVDVFTALIVGVYVGLDGPSWSGARQALFNATSDKVAFCAAYGLTIRAEDWPSHYLAQEVMCDRGEMIGQGAEDAMVSGLGVTLAIAPPYRPDWKSIVESRFRVLNRTSQIHWIPGAVRQRNKERGERDYRLDATLDLAEFTHIILASVLHYNHHHRQPDRLSGDMIAAGVVNATPIELWNWGFASGIAEPKNPPVEAVYRHLLCTGQGSVQAGGIHFKGMFYGCERAEAERWFARARKNGRSDVTLWYDPNTTTNVWVRSADGAFETCHLRKSESRYVGRRFEEVEDMLAIIETPSPQIRHADLTSKVQLDATIEAKIQTASADKLANLEPASKVQRIGNIRENRARERESTPATGCNAGNNHRTTRSITIRCGIRRRAQCGSH
ncbi:Mu transposase C-terminal domain-containing protein (plasmid) [Polaromonas sp. P1-6]|nr:Mu transposase C-terminal domain-containing protein [Polaromonas sp. P1-6]